MNSKWQPHPASWWLLSLGLISVASSSDLPTLLFLVLALAGLGLLVPDGSPMAKTVRLYAALAIAVLITRLFFRILFNFQSGDTGVLFEIPEFELSLGLLGEVKLFGPVTAGGLSSGATEGLRLAAIVLSAGLANTLGSPKKLIRSIPSSLQEIGTALSIAFNFAPAIVAGFERVRTSQSLRGRSKNQNLVKRIVIPVLEDALAESFHLAAAMAMRGFGRDHSGSPKQTMITRILTFASLASATWSTYLLLGENQILLAILPLLLSCLLAAAAIRIGSRGIKRSYIIANRATVFDALLAVLSISLLTFGILGGLR